MDKKISIDIVAAADGAIKSLTKATAAQDKFKASLNETKNAASDAKKKLGDISAYEKLKTALGFTHGEIDKVKKSISELTAKQDRSRKLTEAETAALNKYNSTIDRLNKKKQETGKLTDNEVIQLAKAKEQKEKLYSLNKRETAALDKMNKRLSSLTRQEKAQNRELTRNADKLAKAGFATKNLETARYAATKQAERTARALEKENRLLARSADLQARKKSALSSMPDSRYVGAGVLLAGGAAGRASMENEKSFVDVAKTLNFDSAEDKQGLRTRLNKIAVNMAGVNDAGAMAIAAGGANGGIAKEDLARYTKNTIMTAAAWDMEAGDAATKGMALRNSMNYKDGEAGSRQFMRMANMINDVANNNGGVSGKDLLGVMSRTGALMTNSGFSEEGALGLAGALLSKGATEEQAGTATKNISSRLTAGWSATGAQQEVYSMLGTDAVSVAEGMQTDAMGTLLSVLDGIKGLNKTDQSAAIKELFGEEANAHVQKLLKDTKSLRKIQNDAAKAQSDSVQKEYNDIASTNSAKVERTVQAFNNLAVVVGDRIFPIINPMFDGLTNGVIALTDFMAANESMGTALAATGALVVGAIGAYKAYQAIKFTKGLLGIAKETAALRSAQRARDGYVNSLKRESYAGGGNRRASRRDRPRRRGGLLAAGAGLLATGFAAPSFAGTAADTLGAASDVTAALPQMGGAFKAIRPLAVAMDGVNMVSSLLGGDMRSAAETGGGFLGGMGGAAGGAMLGTMVMPVVGTAIGGAIGGLLGDSVGGDLFAGIYDWFSSDELPDQTEAIKTAQAKEAKARQAAPQTFAPVLNVHANTKEDSQAIAGVTLEAMREQWEQWQAERDDNFNQDLNHSLVTS